MMSGSQTLANGFPLVIPTKTQAPTARLVLRNDLGQVVQQWLIRQNKCTLGSSTSCALRCDAPGIAPYHALLVVGARQIFIRALAPKLTRDGTPVNEVLLTDEHSHFEIAGHRFELSRGTKSDDPAESRQSNKRMKFTLARPFELDNRKRSEPVENTPSTPTDSNPGEGKWMAQLVQAAVEPLECQIQNLLEPIAELQRESRRQREEYEQRWIALQNSASSENSFPEHATIPEDQIKEISARQAASMDVISERISDVNLQLAAIERLVAEDRALISDRAEESDNQQQYVEQVVAQNNAIEQLQTGMVNVAGALQDLESRQNTSREEDLAWRGEVQSQIAGLRTSVEELAERARNPEPVNDDSAWKSEIQEQFSQLREAVERVVTSAQERETQLASQLETHIDERLAASTASTASTIASTIEAMMPMAGEFEARTPSRSENEATESVLTEAEQPSIEDELRAQLLEASQRSSSETGQFESIPETDEFAGAFGLPAHALPDSNEDTGDQPTNIFESKNDLAGYTETDSTDAANPFAIETEEAYATLPSLESVTAEVDASETDLADEQPTAEFDSVIEPAIANNEPNEFENPLGDSAADTATPVAEEFFFDATDAEPALGNLDSGLASSDFAEASVVGEEGDLAFAGLGISDPIEDSPSLDDSAYNVDEPLDEQHNELLGMAQESQPTFDSTELSALETNEEFTAAGETSGDEQELEKELPSWWTEEDQPQEDRASNPFTTRDAFAERDSQEGFAIAESEILDSIPMDLQDIAAPSSASLPIDDGLIADEDEFPTASLVGQAEPTALESDSEAYAELDVQPLSELSQGLSQDLDEEEFPTAAPMSSLVEEPTNPELELKYAPEEAFAEVAQPQADEGIPSAEPQEDGEDSSVEDYMRKLLARMRGTPEEDVPPPPKPAPAATAKPLPAPTPSPAPSDMPSDTTSQIGSKTTESFTTDGTEPFDPEKYVPRTTAPERVRNLAAMRELANSSARTAIHKSTRQRSVASVVLKLTIAGIGFIVGGVLIAINGFQVNIGLIATVAAFLVAGIWGYDAASSLKPLLQSGLILEPQRTPDQSKSVDQTESEPTGNSDAPEIVKSPNSRA